MPLFERTARTFGITDVVKAVFRSQNEPGILCEEQPMRVKYNAVFLINLKHVPMKDLVADGNGTFTNTDQPTHTIEICSNEENESENEDKEKMSYPQVKVLARAKRPQVQISIPAAAILLSALKANKFSQNNCSLKKQGR